MLLKKIRIPIDHAIENLDILGKLDNAIEFIDITKHYQEIKKEYSLMIQRCDLIRTKIKYNNIK